MPSYKAITQGWPDNPKPTDRAKIKRLVNSDRWDELGRLFRFTPVYHNGFNHFIDWRCVPESLMSILQHRPATKAAIEVAPSFAVAKKIRTGETRKKSKLLYDAQGGICYYCKKLVPSIYDWSIDHKLPYARGGTDSPQNRAGCCKPCNNSKGPLTEEEFSGLRPWEIGIEIRAKKLIKSNNFSFFPKRRV